jgi:hypothetical protein
MTIKILNGLIAMTAGVGGAVLLFLVLNALVERLPPRWEHRLKPYVFIPGGRRGEPVPGLPGVAVDLPELLRRGR